MQPRTSFQKRGRGSPDPSRGGASDGGGRNRAARPEVRGWRGHHGPEGARSGFRPRDPEALEGAQGCRRQASGLGLLCVVLSPPVRGDVDSSPGELTWPGKDRGRRTKADAGDRAGLSAKAGPESEPPGETRDRGAGTEPHAGRRVPCSRATADAASRRPRPVPDRLASAQVSLRQSEPPREARPVAVPGTAPSALCWAPATRPRFNQRPGSFSQQTEQTVPRSALVFGRGGCASRS